MEKNGGMLFFSWQEAFQAGTEAAGGKGWNLGRLERYGFRVPAGGVLSGGAYGDFVEENSLGKDIEGIAKTVTTENVGEQVTEEKLSHLRGKIRAGRVPPHIKEELASGLKGVGILERPVAVRSSASAEDSARASFAGIHESFLNVRGLENILDAIKGCYASLWTPRAVAYRRKMNFRDDQVLPAVVIVEMVDAKAAGVAFTCDPRTGQEDVVVISANFGLGESVVSGAVETDEYRLNCWYEITEKRIGRKEGMTVAAKDGGTEFVNNGVSAAGQVLSDENIIRLGLLILRVFEALGQGEQHQDIEWVFDGNSFSIVQARPVTALPRYNCEGIKNQPDIWSNANFRDAAPMVMSTLNWNLSKNVANLLMSSPFKLVGYQLPANLRLVRLYQGRAYQNAPVQQWLYYDAFGLTSGASKTYSGGHHREIEISDNKPYVGIRGFKRAWRLLKLTLAFLRIKKKAKKSFDIVDSFTGDLLKTDFLHLADIKFVSLGIDIRKIAREFSPVFFMLALATVGPNEILIKTLEKCFPGKGNALANALLAGSGDITSAQHGYRLVELAEIARSDPDARMFFTAVQYNHLSWESELPDKSPFKQSFRAFLAEYGHRGVYELDLINPRWREDPSYLLNVISSTLETADLGC